LLPRSRWPSFLVTPTTLLRCQDYAVNGCWHVEVITRDGCPTYLGVDANEYQGSAIVGSLLANKATACRRRPRRYFELDADANGVTAKDLKITCV
jgi:hypothetical protein